MLKLDPRHSVFVSSVFCGACHDSKPCLPVETKSKRVTTVSTLDPRRLYPKCVLGGVPVEQKARVKLCTEYTSECLRTTRTRPLL